ncbi:MAG TPA: alkaline phosphatase [Vicinamibacteria bacterium]
MRGLGLVGLIALTFVGLAQVARVSPSQPSGTHNVILFVGDGLGPTQMTLGIQYARVVEGRRLHMESVMDAGNTGYALPFSYEALVTDSAAAATQIATGQLARNETLGLDADGRDTESIVEWFESRGGSTGLVTNMAVTHATPSAFATHQLSRYDPEHLLAAQLLGNPEIEVLLGGGARAFVARGHRTSESLPGIPPVLDGESVRTDRRDLIEEARARGYTLASDRESLAVGAQTARKLLGLFAASNLPYVVDKRHEGLTGIPSLSELTQAALHVLARNEKGFFLMVEGGRIDYAGHDNDAGSLLQEILDFDEAVGVGALFQSENPETLLLVTADHGTGGFSFTYSAPREVRDGPLANRGAYRPRHYYAGEGELRLLGRQTRSFDSIVRSSGNDPDRFRREVAAATGLWLTPEEAQRAVGGNVQAQTDPHLALFENRAEALLARTLTPQTSVVWSTGGHTTDPLLTFGVGPGAEDLRGVYVNTHLYGVMKRSLEAAE